MNVQVVYFSRSGNTKKLAEAIAKAADTSAHTTSEGVKEADVLFLGASVYAAGIDNEVKDYIASLDADKVGEVVVFSTSALIQRAYSDIKNRLEKRDLKVAEENFYCRGEFLSLHKGRPNESDIADATKFTKEVLAKRG